MYIGNQPLSQAFVTDQFSGNGSTTAFTMSVAPANTASVLVAVSGVLQDPSTYSVSGTTLTFSAAPPSATGNISARYLGIPASGVTTTAYRTITEFTATAGQTTFTPASYTVGFISVYRNGVLLGSADYTASNGTTVVLAVGATAGDLVTTESLYVSSVLNAIPATAGAVNSTYIANNAVGTTQLANGAVGNTQMASGAARANWGAGGILQVVSVTKTDVASTTSATWADISGLSINITPSSASNKILVMYNFFGANDNGGGLIKLVRNSTDIAIGTAATGNQTNVTVASFYNTDTNTPVDMGGTYLDSPSSTSSVTYKAQFRVGVASGTFVINRNISNANAAYTGVGISTITLMEIAA